MGVKISRKKKRVWLLSVIYRLQKLLPISKELKFKLFLNLEWIFDRLSHELSFSFYTPLEHPFRHYTQLFLLKNIDASYSVLDLGCKAGEITYLLASKAKEVVGIDYDKDAIQLAQSLYKKENLKFYAVEGYEFLKNNTISFDVLVLSHVLEHLDEPEEFLNRFKGFFKYIYIEVPDFEKNYLNLYRKKMNLSLLYTDEDHVSEFDREELRSLLKKCNLQVLEEEYRFGVQRLWCKVL
ncbi:MAG: class I SAM-dependent methyltransferase [Cytophagales bacterium]|nr:class I SAM-dependent methyltransferase [Cytophagales bacterium]MDW8384884.1 class I SAM-dependent methyltransferase [Flammeovirgaceae bacterium]